VNCKTNGDDSVVDQRTRFFWNHFGIAELFDFLPPPTIVQFLGKRRRELVSRWSQDLEAVANELVGYLGLIFFLDRSWIHGRLRQWDVDVPGENSSGVYGRVTSLEIRKQFFHAFDSRADILNFGINEAEIRTHTGVGGSDFGSRLWLGRLFGNWRAPFTSAGFRNFSPKEKSYGAPTPF
jgi:hypothetical protein